MASSCFSVFDRRIAYFTGRIEMTKDAGTDELKKRLRKNPRNVQTNLLIGNSYLKAGNFKEAVKHYRISSMFDPRSFSRVMIDYEEALQDDIGNVQARLSLVDFLLSQGSLDAAIVELEELVEIAPETAQIYNLLGRIYLKLGRLDGAISLLEKAKESGKVDVSLLEALANAYIEKERYSDAVMIYEELLRSDPSSKIILRTLRELYSKLSNYDSAAQKCSQMLSDDPEVLAETTLKMEELSRLSPNSPFILEQLANVYMRSLKPAPAVLQLQRIIDLDPEKTDTAVSMLRKLLQTYPENRESLFLLADCLVKKNVFSEAVEIYDRLTGSDPALIDKCIEKLKKIIVLYPDQALAHKSLADAYISKGSFKEALMELRCLVRLNPAEIENIERKCKEILKANPELSQGALVLAESFLASGEARKAIAIAEELVEKDKKNTEAYVVLGEAYLKIDVLNRAKEAFIKAMQLSPLDPDIQKKYQNISEKELDREVTAVKAKIEQDPWRAGLNLDLARLLYKKGSLEQALKALQSAVKDAAKAVASHTLMGTVFKEQGRFDLAKMQFEKVLEFKNSDDPDAERSARAGIGSCLEAFGSVNEALQSYESVTSSDISFEGVKERISRLNQTDPYSARNKALALVFESLSSKNLRAVWGGDARKSKSREEDDLASMSFGQEQNNMGFEQFMKSRRKASEEDFVLATQLDAQLYPASNNLAAANMAGGNLEQAGTSLSYILSEDAANPIFRNNLGVCHVFKDDMKSAEKEFKASLKADKDFSPAALNMGDIEMKRGNIKEAVSYYKKIGRNDPLYELMQRRIVYWIVS
ncbi:MAG: tetratricopeptide repeat protein [Candidatus Saganbacteria bacterium]|nr:tetratricopeptide repeat protein [Candidatus Saganbacteria bacterium]